MLMVHADAAGPPPVAPIVRFRRLAWEIPAYARGVVTIEGFGPSPESDKFPSWTVA